mgnify:CR=1 FL=1
MLMSSIKYLMSLFSCSQLDLLPNVDFVIALLLADGLKNAPERPGEAERERKPLTIKERTD